MSTDRLVVVVNGVGGLDDPDLEACGAHGPPARQHRAGRRVPGRDGGGLRRSDHPVGLPLRGRHRPVRSARPAGRRGARAGWPPVGPGMPRSGPSWPTAGASSGGAPIPSTSSRPAGHGFCRSMWPAGGPPWCRGPSSRPACSPTRRGSSGWRTSTSSAGSVRRASRCWSMPRPPGSVAAQQTSAGRDAAIGPSGPTTPTRPGGPTTTPGIRRAGPPARTPDWYALAPRLLGPPPPAGPQRAERSAIVHGLWDGARGRMGENPRYGRRVGEFELRRLATRRRPGRRSSATGTGRGPAPAWPGPCTSGSYSSHQPLPAPRRPARRLAGDGRLAGARPGWPGGSRRDPRNGRWPGAGRPGRSTHRSYWRIEQSGPGRSGSEPAWRARR